ncbi:hypothetical protein RND81_12G078200 [Saponaria officinalis]|uniref:Uncharacterized protein n=1 Tax=Saponaria officinalis TaxID=3572 RepID=A0AAW1H7V0_SAPOF
MPPKKSVPTNTTTLEVEQLMRMNAALIAAVKNLTRGREVGNSVSDVSMVIARHHPSKYDGTGGPARLEEQLREFQKLFDTLRCLEDMMRFLEMETYASDLMISEEMLANLLEIGFGIDILDKIPAGGVTCVRAVYLRQGMRRDW